MSDMKYVELDAKGLKFDYHALSDGSELSSVSIISWSQFKDNNGSELESIRTQPLVGTH